MKLSSGSSPEMITGSDQMSLEVSSSSAQRRCKLLGDYIKRAEEVTVNGPLDFYHHSMRPTYYLATSVK